MGIRLNIIVTCTKRKTVMTPPELQLRHVKGKTVEERARRWIERVEASRTPSVPAEHLYCGDHWSVAKQLRTSAANRGFDPKLWVISTGYGLVSAESLLKPYSATFSQSHPDTVCINGSDRETFARWWEALSRWKGPRDGGPRTLEQLVQRQSMAAILLVASEAYLRAVRTDLESAAARLRSREQLLIVSGGTKENDELGGSLVPLDARAQAALGGARRTLNIRMARWIVQHAELGALRASPIREKCSRWLARQPSLPVIKRIPSSDDDVRAFVARELKRNPKASFTRLLKRFRERNRACEQFRFRELFRRVREAMDA